MDIGEAGRLLRSRYKYKLEIHVHTSPVSGCSHIPPDEMVRTYKNLGYDAVTITNHYDPACLSFPSKEKFLDRYINDYRIAVSEGQKQGIGVYLGAEVRFTENINDYLVYGIDENDLIRIYDFIPKGIDEFYRSFKNERNLIIHAHPFRDGMSKINPASVDGIEVFNLHHAHNSRIGVAARYASSHPEYIITGGTDCHDRSMEGLGAVMTEILPEDSFELAGILKSKKYFIGVSGMMIMPYSI